jgi:hypothetical protein
MGKHFETIFIRLDCSTVVKVQGKENGLVHLISYFDRQDIE